MVIRTRLRAILFPLALYAVSGGVGGYFVWHAINGERGLKTRVAFKARINDLGKELAELREERGKWERRVQMMQTNSVDRDLLEEEARLALGRLNRNEVVIFLAPPAGR